MRCRSHRSTTSSASTRIPLSSARRTRSGVCLISSARPMSSSAPTRLWARPIPWPSPSPISSRADFRRLTWIRSIAATRCDCSASTLGNRKSAPRRRAQPVSTESSACLPAVPASAACSAEQEPEDPQDQPDDEQDPEDVQRGRQKASTAEQEKQQDQDDYRGQHPTFPPPCSFVGYYSGNGRPSGDYPRLIAPALLIRVPGVAERDPVPHHGRPAEQSRALDRILAEAVADGVDSSLQPVAPRPSRLGEEVQLRRLTLDQAGQPDTERAHEATRVARRQQLERRPVDLVPGGDVSREGDLLREVPGP